MSYYLKFCYVISQNATVSSMNSSNCSKAWSAQIFSLTE